MKKNMKENWQMENKKDENHGGSIEIELPSGKLT